MKELSKTGIQIVGHIETFDGQVRP